MENAQEYMNKARIEVYTSPTCPHCPSAVALAEQIIKERNDVKLKIYSVATPEGNRRATRFGIMATPTILVKGECSKGYIGFRGTPSKKALTNAINKALCLTNEDTNKTKKGFFGFIKKIFSDEE